MPKKIEEMMLPRDTSLFKLGEYYYPSFEAAKTVKDIMIAQGAMRRNDWQTKSVDGFKVCPQNEYYLKIEEENYYSSEVYKETKALIDRLAVEYKDYDERKKKYDENNVASRDIRNKITEKWYALDLKQRNADGLIETFKVYLKKTNGDNATAYEFFEMAYEKDLGRLDNHDYNEDEPSYFKDYVKAKCLEMKIEGESE
jgi:hypothetical protein